MIPFPRLWRRVQAPAEPKVSRELAASLSAALAAVEAADDAVPKRGPAMHFRPADWTMNAATGPTTACGKYVAVAWVTSVPGDVGCLGCQRTVIYRSRTSPAVIPAAGTTRKQES